MLKIGSLADGKYRVLAKIGQGGMSVVYLALNERANKQWAIKEVRKDGEKGYEVVRQRLIAETDILKRLNHPHLPSIIDVIDRDDTFLIVMDYIEGRSLDYRLKKEGAQPQDLVVDWAIQICDVLGYLHSRKPPIIYRDLKPANVMLKPDGDIMIIDFGTAREFKESNAGDTSCLGTVGYAAPEQYGGRGQTDARTDIYTLGTTMYHLLTGHNPGAAPYLERYAIRDVNPELSTGLEKIILKCTQRNPANRYQNCAELMYALEHYTELDTSYRKQQQRKWHSFLGCAVAAAACLFAFGGLRITSAQATSSTYEALLEEAETKSDEDALAYYTQAIRLDAGRSNAYDELLSRYTEDQSFTNAEYTAIDTLLSSSNKNAFRSQNKSNYYEFCYEMGVYLFYYFEGDNSTYAVKWLEEALEEDAANSLGEKQDVAERLCRIKKYAATLENGRTNQTGITSDSDSDDGYSSYSNYWTDLAVLLSDAGTVTNADEEDDVVNGQTAVTICKNFLNVLLDDLSDFKAAGITMSEMNEQIETVETLLGELESMGVEGYRDSHWEELGELAEEVQTTVTRSFTGTGAAQQEGTE